MIDYVSIVSPKCTCGKLSQTAAGCPVHPPSILTSTHKDLPFVYWEIPGGNR